MMVAEAQHTPAMALEASGRTTPEEPGHGEHDLRRHLHKLLHDTKERHHELASDPSKLMAQMEEANSLIPRVNRPTDASLDSEVMNLLAHGGVEIVRKTAQGSMVKYNIDDYVRRLKHRYVETAPALESGDNEADGEGIGLSGSFQWNVLGALQFSTWFRPAPITNHMLGPMDAVPATKRQSGMLGQRRQRRRLSGHGTRPDETENLEDILKKSEEAGKETDRNMIQMWKILGEQPQGKAFMIELCINHDSFSQTIENIFTLSFLVRDGRVSLTTSPEGIVVSKVSPGGGSQQEQQPKERVQFVMALSMEEWESWKGLVERRNALMPTRSSRADESAARQRGTKKSQHA